MLKLIKFEFSRKKTAFAVAGILTLLGQLYALYRFYKLDETVRQVFSDDIFGIFVGFLLMAFGILYFIDIITLFRNDLFKQEGYMLFMTPHNGYKLLGAKLIFALLEGLFIALIYAAIVYLNANIMHMGPIDFSFDGITGDIIFTGLKGLFLGVFMIVEFALTVYISFALFKSLFNNVRFKGLITFAIFLGINFVKSSVFNMISRWINPQTFQIFEADFNSVIEVVNKAMNYGLVATVISAVILFIGTGYLLENRINL